MATPRKIPATIKKTKTHSNRIKSLFLAVESECPRFQAGQFLHLAIDPYDPSFPWPESRVFSIASSPFQRNEIRITFAVKGAFTKDMYNQLNEGDQVWLRLPFGDFFFKENENGYILIAGGTGITPFISFLDENNAMNRKTNIHLIYGIEKPEHFIFYNTIKTTQSINPNFHFELFVDNGEPVEHFQIKDSGYIKIDNDFIKSSLNKHVYISGPDSMINNFEKKFLNCGLKPDHIHIDRWQ